LLFAIKTEYFTVFTCDLLAGSQIIIIIIIIIIINPSGYHRKIYCNRTLLTNKIQPSKCDVKLANNTKKLTFIHSTLYKIPGVLKLCVIINSRSSCK